MNIIWRCGRAYLIIHHLYGLASWWNKLDEVNFLEWVIQESTLCRNNITSLYIKQKLKNLKKTHNWWVWQTG